MSAGEELEAALQRGWSFGELEVYADHLLSANDPRGQIVAIDLLPRPEHQTWVQRRRSAIAGWLGSTLAASAGHLVQHGFLYELRDGMYPPALLDSPAGTYLRGYTTFGRKRPKHVLPQLAAKPRPWLTRLTIANHGLHRLAPAEVRALIAATPRLEEVCFLGAPMFDAFPHPALRRARISPTCASIALPIAAQPIEVPPHATGPTLGLDELELVMELVELAPDCNGLYTYGEGLAEPMPVLVMQLAAAQLVEVAGPVVRASSPGMQLVGRRQAALEALQGNRGWIEPDPLYIDVTNLHAHGNFIAQCLDTFPISGRMSDALAGYHRTWQRAAGQVVLVEPARAATMRAAFAALLELRGLFPTNLGDDEQWTLVERLATELVSERGAHFHQYGNGWW